MRFVITSRLIAMEALRYTLNQQPRPANASFGIGFDKVLDKDALLLPLETFVETYLYPSLRELWPSNERHNGRPLVIPRHSDGATEFCDGQTARAIIYYDLPTGSDAIRVDVRVGDWREKR